MVLNGWLPSWATSFTLTFFLVYVAWGSAGKAGQLVQKERQDRERQGHGDEQQSQEQQQLLDGEEQEQEHQQQGGNGPVPMPVEHSRVDKLLDWCR